MTRNFDGGPSYGELWTVCAEALRAPSAGFSQGTHLLILAEEDLKDFWATSGAERWFAGRSPGVLAAPFVILVLGDQQAYLDRYSQSDKAELGLADAQAWPVPYWLTDAAMVAQNFLLLAEERRWGALFFGLGPDQGEYLRRRGVPESTSCVGAIAVGHRSADDSQSGSPRRRVRRPADELIHRGRWLAGDRTRGPNP